MASGHLFCLTMTWLYNVYDSPESVDRNVYIHIWWLKNDTMWSRFHTFGLHYLYSILYVSISSCILRSVHGKYVILHSLTVLIHTLRCVCKIAKKQLNKLLHVCLSVHHPCPHGITWLPLDRFSWNFVFEYYSKNLLRKFKVH